MDSTAKDRIEAEVVLRPRTPLGSANAPVRAHSARQMEADPDIVEKVSKKLRELGFEVLAQSPMSISIAGTRVSFSRAFKTTDRPGSTTPDLIVPGDLEDYVEGVYIQVPPTYF